MIEHKAKQAGSLNLENNQEDKPRTKETQNTQKRNQVHEKHRLERKVQTSTNTDQLTT